MEMLAGEEARREKLAVVYIQVERGGGEKGGGERWG